MRTLRATTVERIRELRRHRGMTQQGLADRINFLGAPIDRTAIAKIEKGSRELTLSEAFAFAWALDVAPVHLFVPTDDEDPIHIGPNMEAPPAEMRAWIRGDRPMFQDPRVYFSMVPKSEFRAGYGAAHDAAAPISIDTEAVTGAQTAQTDHTIDKWELPWGDQWARDHETDDA
jgi:transcriptional regulator with XRE-family HTH domain